MSDRIELRNMRFEGRHGWHEHERMEPQPFEVDLELHLDLREAGRDDDLGGTVDYALLFTATREIVEGPSVRLLEALAERISRRALADAPRVDEVVVRLRKPAVELGGSLDWAGVEIRRRRASGARKASGGRDPRRRAAPPGDEG
jgi:dihydroneopterin aldolase